MKNSVLLFILLPSTLVGCQANDEHLPTYIEQITELSRKEIKSLPSTSSFSAFIYSQQNARQPFELPIEALALSQPKADKDCWQPEQRTKTSTLERFTIEQLAFKGVISRDGNMSALISTPEGRLAYINKGHHIGGNHGRVSEITEQYLLINEMLPDGLGCWSQRSIKLVMK